MLLSKLENKKNECYRSTAAVAVGKYHRISHMDISIKITPLLLNKTAETSKSVLQTVYVDIFGCYVNVEMNRYFIGLVTDVGIGWISALCCITQNQV